MKAVLITSSILILAVAALRPLLRGRIDPRIQYALWLAVALRLLLPVNMLRHGGDVFLNDLRVADVEAALQVPVTLVEQDGYDLLDAILGRK